MKSGLYQAALAPMKLAFAGEQAFAEQNFGTLQETALGEVGLMGDQDVFDPVGVADQKDVHWSQAILHDVAKLACGFPEKFRRVASEPREHAHKRKSFAERGTGGHAL